MALMVAAMVVFTAFHFVHDPQQNDEAGWNVWVELWEVVRHPSSMGDAQVWVAVASFLTASLLIVVSPFLVRVWIKSKMAWLPTVIFSGISAASFPTAILYQRISDEVPISFALYLIMAAPVLNFIGLLFARSGAPHLDRMAPTTPEEL